MKYMEVIIFCTLCRASCIHYAGPVFSFTSFETVFQLYRDDGRIAMEPRLRCEEFRRQRDSNPVMLGQ